jgi:hypothetical protein
MKMKEKPLSKVKMKSSDDSTLRRMFMKWKWSKRKKKSAEQFDVVFESFIENPRLCDPYGKNCGKIQANSNGDKKSKKLMKNEVGLKLRFNKDKEMLNKNLILTGIEAKKHIKSFFRSGSIVVL